MGCCAPPASRCRIAPQGRLQAARVNPLCLIRAVVVEGRSRSGCARANTGFVQVDEPGKPEVDAPCWRPRRKSPPPNSKYGSPSGPIELLATNLSPRTRSRATRTGINVGNYGRSTQPAASARQCRIGRRNWTGSARLIWADADRRRIHRPESPSVRVEAHRQGVISRGVLGLRDRRKQVGRNP